MAAIGDGYSALQKSQNVPEILGRQVHEIPGEEAPAHRHELGPAQNEEPQELSGVRRAPFCDS